MAWRSAPLFILMGKKSEKPVKEKIRARFPNIFGFVLSLPTRERNTWRTEGTIWAGSDPVSTFGRQNRTNTGVAPAQIEVFVHGLFSERIFAAHCSTEPCRRAAVNRTPIFRGEHCVCSCVHPCTHPRETRARYLIGCRHRGEEQ